MSYLVYRDNIIALLFSFSIFLSHVEIFYLEIRFVYLFSIIFLIYETIFLKIKIKKNIILFTSLLLSIIFLHKYYNSIWLEKNNIDDEFKSLLKLVLVFFTIIIVINYQKVILKNIDKMINYFLIVFCFYTIYVYLTNYHFIGFNLINCSNIFRYDKFLFSELSHFHLISVPIILYSISNIKKIFNKNTKLIIIVLFTSFSFLNFSLTFFLSLLFGSLIFLITSKNINKLTILLILVLNTLSIGIFLMQDNVCLTKKIKILDKSESPYKGVLSPKKKFLDTGLLSNENNPENFTFKVYKNSIFVTINTFKDKLFGFGFDNYKLAFDNYVQKNYEDEKKTSPYREVNNTDGSNNFSKLSSEFGLFFVIICFIIILNCRSTNLDNGQKSLFYSLIFIQTFIRGTGIFYNGFLIISIILIYTLIFQKKKIK